MCDCSVAELKETYYSQSNEAFEKLASCAEYLEGRVAELEAEKADREEKAKAKIAYLRDSCIHQKEKLTRLRGKYAALLAMYNELAEEAKDRSDSSSSSDDSDGDDNCTLM